MKAPGTRNWSLYNRSLVQRGDLCLWISEDLIRNWQKSNPSAHGNQRFSEGVIKAAVILKQVYKLTLRTTEGFLRSVLKLMRLDLETPTFSTICRRSKSLKLDLCYSPSCHPRHILIDATGVRVTGEGEWKVRWHGRTKEQLWRKLHLAIDADSQMILAAEMTESVRLDCNYLEVLLGRIPGEIKEVTGDAGYDKKICYRAVQRRGAKPVFPPQKNASIQRNKIRQEELLKARDAVIRYVGKGPDRAMRLAAWKRENNYHKRSLAETSMSRLKYIFGDEVRARSFENQRTELYSRCYIMNQMSKLGLLKSA